MENDKKTDEQIDLFFNREISWVEFNARVLSEALDPRTPLLERLKFLSIVGSNFDEFFMVRTAGLKRQLRTGNYVRCPSGLSPSEQLDAIHDRVTDIMNSVYTCLLSDILPKLEDEGLRMLKPKQYSLAQRRFAKQLFEDSIFPVLTPVRSESGKLLSQAVNLRIHAAFLLKPYSSGNTLHETDEDEHLAIVQVPQSLDRFIFLPDKSKSYSITLIEDIIIQHAELLFPGYEIAEHIIFRLTRDADIGVDEERDEDFVEAMEEVLINRRSGFSVRLSITDTSAALKRMLQNALGLEDRDIYEHPGPLDLSSLMELVSQSGFNHLRYEEWIPARPAAIAEDIVLWDLLKQKDIMLFHPFESFLPVINLIKEASVDPGVLAIKMTLYRTSGDSPIIRALEKAAEKGKQVTVLVELKARFDEERNIEWAQRLEQAGVIVVYGIARLKVHAKALLIVRREEEGIQRYVHLGTGNYNDKTAKLYTDIGFLSSKEIYTYETSLFFNAITGYSSIPSLTKLIMAPSMLKQRLIQLIERETQRSSTENPGKITVKLNALSDPDIIKALYRASRKGVEVKLNIRGICMLVPGIEGMSKNITVISIVDRFLEHARIMYFYNGGLEEVYCSSADWMPRNLDRRVELMFPIENEPLKKRAIHILNTYFQDNCKAHKLNPDGSYTKKHPRKDGDRFRSQEALYKEIQENPSSRSTADTKEFVVRRKPPRSSS